MMSRQIKDNIIKALIYASSAFSVAILVIIIGFIVIKGAPRINLDFLTHSYEDKTTYVTVKEVTNADAEVKENQCISKALGVAFSMSEEGLVVEKIEKDSALKQAVDGTGAVYGLRKNDIVTKIGDYNIEREIKANTDSGAVLTESAKTIRNNSGDMRVKAVRRGGGIISMVVTTIYMVLLSLLIAGPIGILAAVYLNEYAKKGKMMTLIHFAIENLAGIPSIIYGLFGSLVFVQMLKLQYSLLAGALTVSIILLPTIISTTEETLKTIPKTYRESSLGPGATKLQTVSRVVLPNAISGILVAVLLSIGRIVGESAALLLTAGTVAQIPSRLFGNSASGATLTIKAYMLMKEENDLTTACAIGVILLLIVIIINVCSKLVTKYFFNNKGEQA